MRGYLSALPLTLQVESRLSNAAARQNPVLLDLKRSLESKKTRIAASLVDTGADYRIRTDDLPLTRRLLYQLS